MKAYNFESNGNFVEDTSFQVDKGEFLLLKNRESYQVNTYNFEN